MSIHNIVIEIRMVVGMCECPFFIYKKQDGEGIDDIKKKFSELIKDVKEIGENKLQLSVKYGACEKGIFYPIKNGETLYKICSKFDVAMGDLLAANPHLNPNKYIIGQIIIIPTKIVEEEIFISEYELGEKESIGDILRRFDMCVTRFRQLNPGLDIFNLRAKDKVRIDMPTFNVNKNNSILYCILQGEDLNAICDKFGVSIIEVLKINPNLRPIEFTVGQKIYIPIANDSESYHKQS